MFASPNRRNLKRSEAMTLMIFVFFAILAWRNLSKVAPGAIRFGLEHRDALRSGAGFVKGLFRK